MSAATIVLAVGLAIVSTLVLFDDFRERRDVRDRAAAMTGSTVELQLEEFGFELDRNLGVAEATGARIADSLAAASGQAADVALASAVIDSNAGSTVRALKQVIFQNPLAEVVGVDRFGAPVASPEAAGYDSLVPIGRETLVRFSDRQGDRFVPGAGIASYFPVGVSATGGWLVLILDANELAVESEFVKITEMGASTAGIVEDGPNAVMTAVEELAGSDFVATRTVALPGGERPSWLPFIIRAAGAAVALVGVFVLGHFVRKNYQHATRRLQNAEARSSGSTSDFEQNIIGVVELDEMGIIVSVNQAYCDQVRRDRNDLVGTSLLALTEPADRTRHLAALDKLMTGSTRTTQVEHRVLKGDDDAETWVLEHLSLQDEGESPRILVQSQDITFRRYATWELAKQALHDELTGLANRAMLVHRLRTALNAGADLDTGEKPLLGIMFIDVDRFKIVNDSLGHDVGDRLIQHVGEQMESAVRVNDTVSRFGGDEFVILCDDLTSASEIMAVAERVRASLSTPYVDEGATIHPTLSIGIAICRAGQMSADELLRDADAAMYRAKERGRNRVEVFDEGMRKLFVEQMTLESELRAAIDSEAITMYYQPIVDSSTYATAGFEALIRWPHPTRGLLTPGQFLGVAEEAGLQGRLDTVALKKTCGQMATWAARYPLANELYVSANKVPKNFPQFVQEIREVLNLTGLPANLLVVEVVEKTLLDDADGALHAIETLKELGVRVAIDDFGTGYSSLSYLTQFRPTTLKIDRAFVSRLPEDMATASVVQAITEMALALDISVVAEGVETWEQAEVLHRMGVPYFQGYLFAKPRPVEEIDAWFEETAGAEGRPTEWHAGGHPPPPPPGTAGRPSPDGPTGEMPAGLSPSG